MQDTTTTAEALGLIAFVLFVLGLAAVGLLLRCTSATVRASHRRRMARVRRLR